MIVASPLDIVDVHRDAWLRDAEATIMALDPRDYEGGRTFHVLDFRQVGAPARGYLGFTAKAQLHELAAHLLPHSPEHVPAAAVAVNVDAIARAAVSTADATAGDDVNVIRAAVAAVAAHELAHVLDARVGGSRFAEGTTLDEVVRSLADGRASQPEHQAKTHSPGWLRAYLHLTLRSAGSPHHREWVSRLTRDVAAVMPHPVDAYFDALRSDFLAHRRDDRLVDVLRSPTPRLFLDLFPPQDAGQPARGDLAHACPS